MAWNRFGVIDATFFFDNVNALEGALGLLFVPVGRTLTIDYNDTDENEIDAGEEAEDHENGTRLLQAESAIVTLKRIMNYHLVNSAIAFNQLSCTGNNRFIQMRRAGSSETRCRINTAYAQKGTCNTESNLPRFINRDILTANGNIHSIDRLMLPSSDDTIEGCNNNGRCYGFCNASTCSSPECRGCDVCQNRCDIFCTLATCSSPECRGCNECQNNSCMCRNRNCFGGMRMTYNRQKCDPRTQTTNSLAPNYCRDLRTGALPTGNVPAERIGYGLYHCDGRDRLNTGIPIPGIAPVRYYANDLLGYRNMIVDGRSFDLNVRNEQRDREGGFVGECLPECIQVRLFSYREERIDRPDEYNYRQTFNIDTRCAGNSLVSRTNYGAFRYREEFNTMCPIG